MTSREKGRLKQIGWVVVFYLIVVTGVLSAMASSEHQGWWAVVYGMAKAFILPTAIMAVAFALVPLYLIVGIFGFLLMAVLHSLITFLFPIPLLAWLLFDVNLYSVINYTFGWMGESMGYRELDDFAIFAGLFIGSYLCGLASFFLGTVAFELWIYPIGWWA